MDDYFSIFDKVLVITVDVKIQVLTKKDELSI